jgi:formate dehydrogenase subunit delta
MDPAQLVRMANQIGAFFEAMPDAEQSARDVASHLRRFWEPRMRAALLAHVAAAGDAELKPIVRQALAQLRSTA